MDIAPFEQWTSNTVKIGFGQSMTTCDFPKPTHVRSTTEGYVFTGVCLLTPGGEGTLPPTRFRWGERVPQGTYPPPKSRQGYPKVHTPGQGIYASPPPSQARWDRTTYGVLDTTLPVCLLRSRRRTFLFQFTQTTEIRASFCSLLSLHNLVISFYRRIAKYAGR